MTPTEKPIIQRGADEKKELSASAAGTGSRFAVDRPRVIGTRRNAAENRARGAEWFFGPEKRDIPTMFSSGSKTTGVHVRTIRSILHKARSIPLKTRSIPLKAPIPDKSKPASRRNFPRITAPLSPRGWRIELVSESGTKSTVSNGPSHRFSPPKKSRLLSGPPSRFPRSSLGSSRRFPG